MIQTSIFDMLYPKFKIDKPVRLISLFSGYDSQALALKYLGIPFEHYRTCEWAVKSIQALKDLHFADDNTDYTKDWNILDIKDWLYQKGISSNYNEPMSRDQINKLNPSDAKKIINNIIASHNLVNIQQAIPNDLGIVDTDIYIYILTYSFPCQDLSLAGKRKGMSDTSTRSGMLWEVERLLTECKEKPQVLLMENVIQVHGEGAVQDFNKWQLKLEELGYKNYFEDLIATDYGIPQTRNRCFMVSILGDYSYTFPPKQPLKLRLKDMLEDEVDERYFLSENMQKYIFSENDKYKVNKNSMKIDRDIACSKTTREGRPRADTSDYVTCLLKNKGKELSKTTDVANTLMARDYKGFGNQEMNAVIQIKNATKKGYLDAKVGDGIDISSRMEHHRGNVQKGKSQTISTMGGENVGVVVLGNYSPSGHNASRVVDKSSAAPTIMENHGTITATQTNDLRIRKLTPKECFRLMGVKDEDYEKIAKNQSNSSLYHLAGDSIVVNVLMAIFKEML